MQNRSGSPLGAHFGPMLYKSSISNAQKNRPEASKSAKNKLKATPNPPRMESKTLPNPIFMRFLDVFFRVQICNRFFVDFSGFFVKLQCLETLKIVLPSRRELNFYKIAFFENQAKNNRKKPPKILPKTLPNPPKIEDKSPKITTKMQDG